MADYHVSAGQANWHFGVWGFGTEIGPDGNAISDVILNGVSPVDYMAINGRVFTATNREPFNPAFGCGLPQALFSANPLPASGIEGRLRASFADDPGYVARSITVAVQVRGRTVEVHVGGQARE